MCAGCRPFNQHITSFLQCTDYVHITEMNLNKNICSLQVGKQKVVILVAVTFPVSLVILPPAHSSNQKHRRAMGGFSRSISRNTVKLSRSVLKKPVFHIRKPLLQSSDTGNSFNKHLLGTEKQSSDYMLLFVIQHLFLIHLLLDCDYVDRQPYKSLSCYYRNDKVLE